MLMCTLLMGGWSEKVNVLLTQLKVDNYGGPLASTSCVTLCCAIVVQNVKMFQETFVKAQKFQRK